MRGASVTIFNSLTLANNNNFQMRYILFFILFISMNSYSQLLSGDLVNEGRNLVSEESFVKEGRYDGIVTYELAVDRTGKVTSARLIGDQTTISSTPVKIEVYKHLMQLKFEAGTHYPEFHHVVVKMTVVKSL